MPDKYASRESFIVFGDPGIIPTNSVKARRQRGRSQAMGMAYGGCRATTGCLVLPLGRGAARGISWQLREDVQVSCLVAMGRASRIPSEGRALRA